MIFPALALAKFCAAVAVPTIFMATHGGSGRRGGSGRGRGQPGEAARDGSTDSMSPGNVAGGSGPGDTAQSLAAAAEIPDWEEISAEVSKWWNDKLIGRRNKICYYYYCYFYVIIDVIILLLVH